LHSLAMDDDAATGAAARRTVTAAFTGAAVRDHDRGALKRDRGTEQADRAPAATPADVARSATTAATLQLHVQVAVGGASRTRSSGGTGAAGSAEAASRTLRREAAAATPVVDDARVTAATRAVARLSRIRSAGSAARAAGVRSGRGIGGACTAADDRAAE